MNYLNQSTVVAHCKILYVISKTTNPDRRILETQARWLA